MQHLLNLSLAELRQWLADQGLPAYRAAQIHKWIYEKRAGTFDEMSDLPKDLRERLAAEFTIFSSTVSAHKIAEDGTEKLLLEWPDGHRIECVLIREGKRRTICISTQVGCAMGCVFCASGVDGVARSLTAAAEGIAARTGCPIPRRGRYSSVPTNTPVLHSPLEFRHARSFRAASVTA